ncbi:MAG TPA: glucokinase [Ktedonobacterales bacterium]|jgi:glucokinase
MLLAGDIGGTKTNLAIFSPKGDLREPQLEATFPSSHYPSLEAVVQEFLGQTNLKVDRASFGVAGPVIDGQATITNLPWKIDAAELKRKFNFSSVYLLNDLESIANAVPILQPADLHTIHAGEAVPHGAIAVVAPGTGLGEAFLTWNAKDGYVAHVSEGGHTDFAPTDDLQMGLLQFMLKRFDHVSYERVCSGMGLPNIYEYLKASGHAPEPDWLARALAEAHDHTPVIVNAALEGKPGSELCVETLKMFVSILGAEAGNIALKVLSTGGVYLGGGIPPRILSLLTTETFANAFREKGRFVPVLTRMPVHVILNPKSALLGAAARGMKL